MITNILLFVVVIILLKISSDLNKLTLNDNKATFSEKVERLFSSKAKIINPNEEIDEIEI